MIDLYYWPMPNGHKITIALEELELPYGFRTARCGARPWRRLDDQHASDGDASIKEVPVRPDGRDDRIMNHDHRTTDPLRTSRQELGGAIQPSLLEDPDGPRP